MRELLTPQRTHLIQTQFNWKFCIPIKGKKWRWKVAQASETQFGGRREREWKKFVLMHACCQSSASTLQFCLLSQNSLMTPSQRERRKRQDENSWQHVNHHLLSHRERQKAKQGQNYITNSTGKIKQKTITEIAICNKSMILILNKTNPDD